MGTHGNAQRCPHRVLGKSKCPRCRKAWADRSYKRLKRRKKTAPKKARPRPVVISTSDVTDFVADVTPLPLVPHFGYVAGKFRRAA